MVDKRILLDKFSFVKIDEPLKNYCTFKIGGRAEIFAKPKTKIELMAIVNYLRSKNTNYKIIGNGSNILFLDGTIKTPIIVTTEIKGCRLLQQNVFEISAGESLSGVALKLSKMGYSGLEFAVGIPGTVGGAVSMNAGAFGFEIKEVIQSVCYFDGEITKTLSNKNCEFGYRTSKFKKMKNAVIMSVLIKLKRCEPLAILNRVNEIINKRRDTQPSGKSAGSVFKRVEGQSAGFFIEGCGLKGKNIGGAIISPKHANFILNNNNASADDVKKLINLMVHEVKAKFNKSLDLEIEIVE